MLRQGLAGLAMFCCAQTANAVCPEFELGLFERIGNETGRWTGSAEIPTPVREALDGCTPDELAAVVTRRAHGGTGNLDELVLLAAFEAAADDDAFVALRHKLDYDGDVYSVARLLETDIDAEEVAAALRDLIAAQARTSDGSGARGIKLLSDVDDTIYANLVDPRYVKMSDRGPIPAPPRCARSPSAQKGNGFISYCSTEARVSSYSSTPKQGALCDK